MNFAMLLAALNQATLAVTTLQSVEAMVRRYRAGDIKDADLIQGLLAVIGEKTEDALEDYRQEPREPLQEAEPQRRHMPGARK